jgi:ABC-2 type transport system permease protein
VWRVVNRELRRIWRSPRYLVILTLAVALSFVFFATMTQEGQPQKLHVAVVDFDHSYLSRRLCHELEATQGVHIAAIYDNHTEARLAMQRGDIFAFYEIPAGTYNELLQFHAPRFSLYTNQSYLLAGSLSYRQLATMGKLAAGAVQREVLRKKGYKDDAIMGMIQPIVLDTHPVGNTKASYCIYLMTTLIPGIIALIAMLHTAYVIGRERQERTVWSWMRKAGGNGLKALVGKAIPYTVYYTMLLLVANYIMYGPMAMPLEGSWLLLSLHSLLLITAAQSAAIFLMACVPDPSVAMSLTSAYATLSFTMCGFSFPVDAMPLPMQVFSMVFPLRHYFLAMRDIAFFGNGLDICWPQTCTLVAFGVLAIVGSYIFNRQYERGRAC